MRKAEAPNRQSSKLRRRDWDFSCYRDWPEAGTGGLRHVWAWEMDRELGSGKGPFIEYWKVFQLRNHNDLSEAFNAGKLAITEKELKERLLRHLLPNGKAAPPVSSLKMLEEKPIAYVLGKIPSYHINCGPKPFETLTFREAIHAMDPDRRTVRGETGYYSKVHALEIDWQLSEKELLERFKNWLRHGEHEWRTSHKRRVTKGQGNNYPAWFTALAIYRLNERGEKTRPEIAAMLGTLKDPFRMARISSANFSRAKRETKLRIAQRQKTLLEMYANVPGGHWTDYFAKL